jgi:hypothetical protein
MASTVYLASMVVMGVLALLVIALTATGRDWVSYSPQIGPPSPGRLAGLAQDVRVWVLAFFVLVLVATAGTITAASGGSTTLLLAGLGVVVFGFLTLGVYFTGRSRGHAHSYAVGETVITIGALILVALAAFLLTNFGA